MAALKALLPYTAAKSVSTVHDSHADVILDAGVFHQGFYEHQRSDRFGSEREAFEDFLSHGVSEQLSPHPLFDVRFYLAHAPAVAAAHANPVLHYLQVGWREGRDPHPLFDSAWYASQLASDEPVNPLTHYLQGANPGLSPNPLFDHRAYVRAHDDVARSGMSPLAHYVLYGRDERRAPTPLLRDVLWAWRDTSMSLKRGTWRRDHTVWVLLRRDASAGSNDGLARVLLRAHERARLDLRVLLDDDLPQPEFGDAVKSVSLKAFGVALDGRDVLRPSALRMLVFALSEGVSRADIWQSVDEPRLGEAFTDLGLPVASTSGIQGAPDDETADVLVATLIESSSTRHAASVAPRPTARRLVIPCTDWSVSGVHTAAEALAEEMIARGWDVRLLFTRGTIGVLDRAAEGLGLPRVPYEFLDTSACRTPREHWAAIIRDLERRAPCVVLSTFDDFANAVAPALSDQVGVVGWLQSDEDHYYESAYRLGRYWNALIGVSQHIADRVVALNPSFDVRTSVIHNSVVKHSQVSGTGAPAVAPGLRLVYVGRLVQYQKRILDVIPLVAALERRQVPYQLTLIGAAPDPSVDRQLQEALALQVATGVVRLTGPLGRVQVQRELEAHNVFLLLSDFEGLPVSLIEAMACGCVPVVARTHSGIPDVVDHGHNGLVFDTRDYTAWASALDSLARHPDRLAAMAGQARRAVRDRFTVEIMADQFEVVLAGVLQQIETSTWTRPPALTWKNPAGDVSVPPALVSMPIDGIASS